VEALRNLLIEESARTSHRYSAGQHFRYAKDRTFTVAGSGTVVTGTVFNGSVAAGDKLVVSPRGIEVRVRGIQIQGKTAQRASAGERCALNLAGSGLDAMRRGDWVLAPEIHKPTSRMDARVKLLANEERALAHWTPVHVHLATSDVTARVATRGGSALAPGGSAIVQLVLDESIGALRGDRFILRDQSANRTIGGGIVLDPYAPATRRGSPARLAELAALEHDAPGDALRVLAADHTRAIDLSRFEIVYNITGERASGLYKEVDLVQLGKEARIGVTRSRCEEIRSAMLRELTEFHRKQPQAVGMEVEALREAVARDLPPDAFAGLLRSLADERKVEAAGSTARLSGHNATANAADDRLWQTVRPVLESSGFNAPPLRDLALQVKLREPVVKDFLHRKAKTGEVMKVTPDRFYTRSTLATLAAVAQATAQAQASGQFTAAQYRDATGLGRSLAIEILEFLDTLGITQRIGDARKMRKDFVPILGAASAPPRSAAKAPAKPAPAPKRAVHNFRR
jgi:selenocysteine-specific elongation factor